MLVGIDVILHILRSVALDTDKLLLTVGVSFTMAVLTTLSMRDKLVQAGVGGAVACGAGLDEQHDGDGDEDHDDTEFGEASLGGEHVHVDGAGLSDEGLLALGEEVVDHDGDD